MLFKTQIARKTSGCNGSEKTKKKKCSTILAHWAEALHRRWKEEKTRDLSTGVWEQRNGKLSGSSDVPPGERDQWIMDAAGNRRYSAALKASMVVIQLRTIRMRATSSCKYHTQSLARFFQQSHKNQIY